MEIRVLIREAVRIKLLVYETLGPVLDVIFIFKSFIPFLEEAF